MSVDSLLTTLEPGARPRSMEALTITGWARAWNVLSRRTFLDDTGQRVRRVVLGVEPVAGASTEGIVFDLGAEDMARLRMRERAYHEVDVGDAVTFVPDAEHRRGEVPSDYPLVVERTYFQMCTAGAREHGLDDVADELGRILDLPIIEPAGGIRIEELTG